MKLFHIVLKLIEVLGLTSSSEYSMLANDVKEWELDCKEDSEDKLKQLYWKLHKGVFFRLLAPFIFAFTVKQVREIMNGETTESFFEN